MATKRELLEQSVEIIRKARNELDSVMEKYADLIGDEALMKETTLIATSAQMFMSMSAWETMVETRKITGQIDR